MKKCPICKKVKSVEEFSKYFSKARQKFRISNYCIVCGRAEANKRSKIRYKENREKIILYVREYERKNHARYLEIHRNVKRRRRENLEPVYIRDIMVQRGFNQKTLHENPELVTAYGAKLLLKRTIKKLKNGKKQTEGTE